MSPPLPSPVSSAYSNCSGDVGPLILLCAGGTGGHAFPARALAEKLISMGLRVAIATDQRAMKYFDDLQDAQKFMIKSGGYLSGLAAKIKAARDLVIGLRQSYVLLKKLKPAVVIGFGGYPTVPPVLMAQILGVPTILHEQNAILGLANKILAPRARKIALSVAATQGIAQKWIGKTLWTGNPVRGAIIDVAQKPYLLPDFSNGEKFQIMVVAGSQGAKIFSDLVPRALVALPLELRTRVKILQQARLQDCDHVREIYRDGEMEVIIAPFFDNMAECLTNTHLFVARSGASTTAELTCTGRPAIYIPFPWHKDQQQLRNAEQIALAGGAVVAEERSLTPELLTREIEQLLTHPQRLSDMAKSAKSLGMIDAVDRLADMVLPLLSPAPIQPTP